MRTVEGKESFLLQFLVVLLTAFGNLLFGFCQILCSQLALNTHQSLYQRLIFLKHLVVAFGHRTGDDKRSTGIVDQHGVNLVDNSVVMGTLHEVLWRNGHVVAQIVETELVVGTEGDITLISTATGLGVGLVLVNAVNAESVEHIERSHPLRVTFGQIVVHGNDVNTVTCQSVEEDGQGSDQRLTFTRSHLGNLTLMQYNTTEELYVIVNHLPFQVVATSCPVVMIDSLVAIDGNKVFLGVASQFTVEICSGNDGFLILGKATGCLLDDAEHFGHHLVEGYLVNFKGFLFQLVNLSENLGTLVDGRVLDGPLQSLYFLFLCLSRLLHLLLDVLGALA